MNRLLSPTRHSRLLPSATAKRVRAIARGFPVLLATVAFAASGHAHAADPFGIPEWDRLEGVTQLSARGSQGCARIASGKAMCWGANDLGQLGDGSLEHRNFASAVVSLGPGVRMVSAGGGHGCAVTAAGAVKCWGWNFNGQLGNGSTLNSPVPVDAIGAGITSISMGGFHSCALTTGGTVKCWGLNMDSQLGDGTAISRKQPVDVLVSAGVPLANIVAISAGYQHTCALNQSGAVLCWGSNAQGHLGNGTGVPSAYATPVPALASGVQSISAGAYHACALTTNGAVMCWGSNDFGQIGNGNMLNQPVPVTVIASGIRSIGAGLSHSCAVTLEGTAKCWGSNASGQLGGSPAILSWWPVDATVLTANAMAISTGSRHTCALMFDASVQCWGSDEYGQLGEADLDLNRVMTPYVPDPDVFANGFESG